MYQFFSPFWWSFTALSINEFFGLQLFCTSSQELQTPILIRGSYGEISFKILALIR